LHYIAEDRTQMAKVQKDRNRAQISRAAIQRLHITMRHLFIRGIYKPLGVSGEAMIQSMLSLKPEIYGSVADPEKVELNGLLYIFNRLPQGIEQCRYITLISREGLENSGFEAIVPSKRRRNCYRIDKEQMYIEMTRGSSDIYDVLTHLTFMYIEAEKIRKHSLDARKRKKREWKMLEEIVQRIELGKPFNTKVGYTYLSNILGRTYEEVSEASKDFDQADKVNSLFTITYWMGQLSMEEFIDKNDRQINFTSTLREEIGHHIYGELWANQIKHFLYKKKLLNRPIHIISANLHSVMNAIYAKAALQRKDISLEEIASLLSNDENYDERQTVRDFASKNGMYTIEDKSGTNITVQIFDLNKVSHSLLPDKLNWNKKYVSKEKPIIIMMDYAFGEQAYETMDELLKPFEIGDIKAPLNVTSINVMGKAGILKGGKGDIMIPSAFFFEGSADNYPFNNECKIEDFEGHGVDVYEGTMITVLGTSLQNKDILRYFLKSSWRGVGLEMEGAHYQKAIQAASKIRLNIIKDVKLRYAYYASDNPLETGSTLASGSLGLDGVKPTYLITLNILNGIMNNKIKA